MKRKRYSKEQIAFALRQGESGTPIAESVRKMGITERTYYRWKKKMPEWVSQKFGVSNNSERKSEVEATGC